MPLAKRIVPCLDVDHGKVVKCINFLNPKCAGDPVEMAKQYSDQGADELVFLANGRLVQGLGDGLSAIADLGVGYDALAKRASITSTFVGGGAAFKTDGIDPSPWLLRGGLGLTMINSKAMEISARYDIEARPSNYNNQTISLKLRMPF